MTDETVIIFDPDQDMKTLVVETLRKFVQFMAGELEDPSIIDSNLDEIITEGQSTYDDICDPVSGGNLFHFICYYADKLQLDDFVMLFIVAGTNINRLDNNGDTPLSLACFNNNVATITRLLDANADSMTRNKSGYSPLMLACNSLDIISNNDIIQRLADLTYPVIEQEQEQEPENKGWFSRWL